MTDLYFFSLTVINCFVLGFMCMVVNFSETLFPRQRRTFLLTFILIGVISVLELVTVIVDGAPVRLRPVNIMANYLGFGLTPAVPLLMVYAMDRSDQVGLSLKAAAALEILYLLILTAGTFFGGLVFAVYAENH